MLEIYFDKSSTNTKRAVRWVPILAPLKQDVVGDVGQTLWVLMGTIALVLLMACANVANLLLVRAESRRQEFAIRAALGAPWTRVARALLVESMVLALLGGALGLALAVRRPPPAGGGRAGELAAAFRDRDRPGGRPLCACGLALCGPLFSLMPIAKYCRAAFTARDRRRRAKRA